MELSTLIDKLNALEPRSKVLESDHQEKRQWTRAVTGYAESFYSHLPQAKAYNQSPDLAAGIYRYPIGESGRPLSEVLGILEKFVDNEGINPASGRHMGYIPGGGLYPTALADYLAAVTNRYAGMFYANPGAVRVEDMVIRWLCEMVGYPDQAYGNLASGGSIANLIAITTARDHLEISAEKITRSVVYLTQQVHHCIQKALRIAGLQECIIRYVPMNDRFQMDTEALRQQVNADRSEGLFPFLIVASAGTTDTGAIDPIAAIGEVARDAGAWFHVDGAYGGAFMLAEELRPKFTGLAEADSITIDPHKGLFLSYGLGAILFRDARPAYEAHHYTASYLQDADLAEGNLSPSDFSPELTKHFRGLRLWLPLQLYGIGPFRAALEEKALLCQYFFYKIQEVPGFEVGPFPDLSIAVFRYAPKTANANAFNQALVRHLHRDGQFFLSTTTIEGTFWIRMAVLSCRTHREDIDACIAFLEKAVREVQSETSEYA